MPISVRLDPETEALLRRLARLSGRTRSEVIREALRRFAETDGATTPRTPYAAMEHLIGCADSGGRELSKDTGKKFRELLEARRRGRRSR